MPRVLPSQCQDASQTPSKFVLLKQLTTQTARLHVLHVLLLPPPSPAHCIRLTPLTPPPPRTAPVCFCTLDSRGLAPLPSISAAGFHRQMLPSARPPPMMPYCAGGGDGWLGGGGHMGKVWAGLELLSNTAAAAQQRRADHLQTHQPPTRLLIAAGPQHP